MSVRTPRLLIAVLLATFALTCLSTPRSTPAADEKAPKAKKSEKSSGTFEVYKDAGGKYRWRLKSTNGQTIATPGQGFSDKRSCMDNIESVRRAAANASVEEAADDGK
jgi:uncharacterized protein YegP (UPF0339 family)